MGYRDVMNLFNDIVWYCIFICHVRPDRQHRYLRSSPAGKRLATIAASAPQRLATTAPHTSAHLPARTPATDAPAAPPRTTTAGRNKRQAHGEQLHSSQEVVTHPSWPGKPQFGPLPLSLSVRCLASPPTGFPQSARQARTGSPLSLPREAPGKPAHGFPQSARQARTGSPLPYFGSARQARSPLAVSDSRPAARWSLIPVDLPTRTPPRPVKPWYPGAVLIKLRFRLRRILR